MRLVFGLARLSLALAFGAFAIALCVARVASTADPDQPTIRTQDQSRYVEVNSYSLSPTEPTCIFLDSETGKLVPVQFTADDAVLFGATSPWSDGNGERQVVGRWMNRQNSEAGTMPQGFGLGRYTFPSGKLIDHVPLDVVPTGMPVWYPGIEARILYAGTDGHLYELRFDESRDGSAPANDPDSGLRPREISWRCATPGLGQVRISDPVWPTDPRLNRRLLVSLSYLDRLDGNLAHVPTQLWWIELSTDGTAIVDAGRLTVQRRSKSMEDEERLPSVASTPDGTLALGYLGRAAGKADWQLRLAPIAIDSASHRPRVRTWFERTISEGVAVNTPTFSSDGRWIHVVRSSWNESIRAERVSVSETLAQLSTRHLASYRWHGRGRASNLGGPFSGRRGGRRSASS